jgi:hypothetical protein
MCKEAGAGCLSIVNYTFVAVTSESVPPPM